ncbi:MAG TPA: MBL fold metallo-hydrolase [Vicinamibacterales bacterium]|nr:MBL fold metallo-hydrolase [Vicinamibacterales bacterium]HPW19782.1 MBL fold metallo-hydrolase [Vicinamibacterales bacterium]
MTSPVRGLTGFSRAMFSNWLWHEPLGLVIDAGEGLQLALGQRIWSPRTVALTHGHADHVLGLPGFIASRRYAKGAQDKPLAIVYPEGNAGVLAVRELVGRLWPNEAFPVTWTGVRAGDEFRLGKALGLRAFAATHGGTEPTLGYVVFEERRRLKPAFAGLAEPEVRQLAREGGRDALMEPYRHVRLAHSGDSMPVDPSVAAGADLLVHDATFLDAADRRREIHATASEALEVGRAAGVRCLVLQHLSIRYDRASAIPALREQVAASGFAGACWLLDDGRLTALNTGPGLWPEA